MFISNTFMTALTFQKVISFIIQTVLCSHLEIKFIEIRIQTGTYMYCPPFSVNFLKQITKQLHYDDRSRTATFYRNHANHSTLNCYVHLNQTAEAPRRIASF